MPKNGAQQLADRLVNAGAKGIWNFAPIDLNVSKDVIVENVNLTESLFTLSYLMKDDI
ncbi:Redox-sensing transcriptional repressor Rex [bioreactor metagenome]|uniref:Redox-sensing transcriptional repressor Rex n=1 Tax=bioreactor metagenome TaxID=1076179 RepID=A0A644YLM9_9ZZZZ